MFCEKCGAQIIEGKLFCGKCGNKLEKKEKKYSIIDYLLLGFTLVAFFLTIIPLNIIIIYGTLGISCVLLSVCIYLACKIRNNINLFCLIANACLLIVEFGWVFYINVI